MEIYKIENDVVEGGSTPTLFGVMVWSQTIYPLQRGQTAVYGSHPPTYNLHVTSTKQPMTCSPYASPIAPWF